MESQEFDRLSDPWLFYCQLSFFIVTVIIKKERRQKNVLDILFQMDEVHLYMSRPERFKIDEKTELCFNDKEIVTGRHGYETWWSAEYERRENDDL